MAIAVVSFQRTATGDWGNTGNSLDVSWSAGDLIVVAGTSPYAGDDFNTPTATGLTFTQRSIMDGGAGTQNKSAMWTAVAGSSGTNVTVGLTTTLPFVVGMVVWVLSGAGTVTGITGDDNEQAFTVTTSAGDAVLVLMGDFNGASPTRSPTTGSGTATERLDNDNAPSTGGYGIWAADWIGTSAGTFTFGASSYAGTRDAQVGIVVAAGAGGGGATSSPPARRRPPTHLIVR